MKKTNNTTTNNTTTTNKEENTMNLITMEEAMSRKDLHLVFDDENEMPAGRHIHYRDSQGNRYFVKVPAPKEADINSIHFSEEQKERLNKVREEVLMETNNTQTQEGKHMNIFDKLAEACRNDKKEEKKLAKKAKLAAIKAAEAAGNAGIKVSKRINYAEGYAVRTMSQKWAAYEITRREEALKSFKEGILDAEERIEERKEDKVIKKALTNVQ